jgi:LPS export ABC transporter protein LptC
MRSIALAALAAASLAGCGGGSGPVTAEFAPLPADQVLEGVEHVMTNAGVRQAVLKADSTLVFNDSARVHLRRVNLEMFNEQGRLHATLTALRGVLDQSTNRMVAMGSVVLVIHEGPNAGNVLTQELHYDPQQRVVWSDVRTERILRNGQRGVMDSFRVDDRFGNMQMVGYRGPAGTIRF